jgi:hypothetical protein
MARELYPYKSGPIEPIAKPGDMVGIWVNKTYNFYSVEYIDTIPMSDPVQTDMGALAAGATAAQPTQLTLLEMPDKEFGQFRCMVLDDISVVLSQGRADQRHKLNTRVSTYTRFGGMMDPCGHETEFYVYYNNWAFMTPTNQTDYALTQSRVNFWGFRYVLEEQTQYSWKSSPKALPTAWTRVPAGAHL